MGLDLAPGQNTALPAPQVTVAVTGGVDLTALVLSADGKVSGDADMVFFNQPQAPGLTLSGSTLQGQLGALRGGAAKVVLVATPETDGQTFGQLSPVKLAITSGGADVATFTPHTVGTETALILAEIYERNGGWKVRGVGQGYANGLAGVATDFGISVDDDSAAAPAPPPAAATPPPAPAAAPAPAPTPPPAAAPSAPLSLEKKRMVNLEKKLATENPQMLSLVKQAGVSLEKRGLSEHTARVALCLDISGSMGRLYYDGAVQRLAERVLALALRFDDDGEVDVFLFGKNAYQADPMDLANSGRYVNDMQSQYPLEGGTHYGKVLKLVREHYFGSSGKRKKPLQDQYPVYLMFVTDGATMDRDETVTQVTSGSYEPLFIQFMGIGDEAPTLPGKQNKRQSRLAALMGANFEFLHKLDDLSGRLVDNADFFSVTEQQLLGSSPIPDDQLFELMMTEYPAWIPQARSKGLLP